MTFNNHVTFAVPEDILLNLLVLWLVNQKSNVPAAKCTKIASSAGKAVALGTYIPATPDDNDVCEVEWDSPRPLSGNIYLLSCVICLLI